MLKGNFLPYALSGAAGGVLGGMGMGGGTALVPILSILFSVSQHLCQGANLISFVPMAIVALIIHFKNKMVELNGLFYAIIPALLTAAAGGILSANLSSEILKKSFGAFLIVLSAVQCFADKIQKKAKTPDNLKK